MDGVSASLGSSNASLEIANSSLAHVPPSRPQRPSTIDCLERCTKESQEGFKVSRFGLEGK